VEDVAERLRPVTARHEIRISVPDDVPPVWLVPVEIGEVLYNLVENAAKYAPPDTELHIQVSRDPGVWALAWRWSRAWSRRMVAVSGPKTGPVAEHGSSSACR
jgi:signal transduction histidine kinase